MEFAPVLFSEEEVQASIFLPYFSSNVPRAFSTPSHMALHPTAIWSLSICIHLP